MNIKEQLLETIQANPGLTADEIRRELAKHSWAAQRFGEWAAMFGPTYGALYVALAQLARDGSVDTNGGEATAEKRKGRALRYYARRTPTAQPHAESAADDVTAVEERSATGAKPALTGQLLEVIQANPGLTAVEIRRTLAERSWAAQRFGKWATMFGPTYGAMYVALAQLAREGSVNTNRGEATAEKRKGHPLRYYARETPTAQPHAKSAVDDVAAVEERSATGAEPASTGPSPEDSAR
jgi:DNA-binding PadR family transcriptional regulator